MASILTPLKKISPDPYIFLLPMTYHLRGISKFFSEAPIKTALLIPYLVRGFENFLPEGLILPLSRDLPLEGEKFPATPVKMTSPIPKLVRRIFRMAKHKEKFCGVPANTPPKNGSTLSKYSEGIYRDQPIKKKFPETLKNGPSNGLTSGRAIRRITESPHPTRR